MTPTLRLPMVDGVQVVVPDSLSVATTYVLSEQGDWFEDEIRFVRTALQAGEQAIDIGANVGVYALSMALKVGAEGRVWAFEPTPATADLLEESIALNGFAQTIVDRRAVSDRVGECTFVVHPEPELNGLLRSGMTDGTRLQVPLTTLDVAAQEHGWHRIDFVKIDAEGEEAAIVRGGAAFFDRFSPLVQFEVVAGRDLQLDLVEVFSRIGYRSYRLVPGIGVLAPFDPAAFVPGDALNLFACKPDRAARLAERGLLAMDPESPGGADELLARNNADGRYDWSRSLASRPYARALLDGWRMRADRIDGALIQSLALHAMAMDATLPPDLRVAALTAAMSTLSALCRRQPSGLHFLSLARVARESGAAGQAFEALRQQYAVLRQAGAAIADEPFLAASGHFDDMPPGSSFDDWVMASILEEIERGSSYSSYYGGANSYDRLKMIARLGFGRPEMARRLSLVARRFGLA